MQNGQWQIYLSGEIHTNWREQIAEGVEAKGLPVATEPGQVVEILDYVIAGRLG